MGKPRLGAETRSDPLVISAGTGGSLVRDEKIWGWAVRVSIVGLFVLAFGATLNAVEHVVVPLILAWVVSTVLTPIVELLSRIRIPRALAAVLVVTVLLTGVVVVLILLTVPLTYWLSRADELGELIKDKLALLHRPLEMLEQLGRAINPPADSDKPPVFVNTPQSTMIFSMFGVLTPAVDEFMIFLIALVFHLIYQREIQDGLVALTGDPPARALTRTILQDIERNMSSYFGTISVVNVFVGLATMGIAYMLGFPHPILWGVFAAVLNYIPYLGPVLVMGAFFVIGVVVFPTLWEATLAPLLFLVLNTLEGQVITPSFIGHRLTINPFLVFLSIAFWTCLWGPLGAFLAVPILLTTMIAGRHLSDARQQSAD